MQNWNLIRPIVEKILRQQQYTSSGKYNGTPCFLTAYQIAVLVNQEDDTLKGDLPIGGRGVGPDSFAKQIAWHLSEDINKDIFNERLEIQFLSLAGLETFAFDGGNTPSTDEFSMFRYI